MSRVRVGVDWSEDLEAARPIEREVAAALCSHPAITEFVDHTDAFDQADFEVRIDGARVQVEVKSKQSPLSPDYQALWPEVPERHLLMVDERSIRSLLWAEGLGYLVVRDLITQSWHLLGPWELVLGPRQRLERREIRKSEEFLKGKLLLDLRTAAVRSPTFSVDRLLDVVRSSKVALRDLRALPIQGQRPPILPRVTESRRRPPDAPRTAGLPPPPRLDGTSAAREIDARWMGLDPNLVAAIKDAWSWQSPTAIQAAAIPLVLAGANALILAPTAGGKTEAALLPLLDVQRQGAWRAPSIVMVSPRNALLDDQLPRYQKAAALTGATAFAWHGDVDYRKRDAFKADPADILLTTPESLENLLSNPGQDSRILSRLQAVVVDEAHDFAGTARGAQLAALLERLDQRANTDLQRIALSATVGNPAEVLAWLHGGSQRAAEVVAAAQPLKGEELTVATYETTAEAANLISQAVAGQTSLVFAPSRRRAEELGITLGVPVHHSSVSAEARAAAIAHLKAPGATCIVATSSLEMGIDVGDIELVVNDGAPSDPGAYQQRLGRAGRRNGNRRMLITVGNPDSLLLALATVARSRRGDLEPVPPTRSARLVIGQQILALAFERTAIRLSDLRDCLRWSPVFDDLSDEIAATVDHLVATGWLGEAGDFIVTGGAAQHRFGGRRFADLLTTFESSAGARVLTTDGTTVGTLDWRQVTDDSGEPRPGAVTLSGRAWTIVSVNRAGGTVTVAPASRGRVPSWRGPSLEVSRATWQAAREILVATDIPVDTDDRAQRWLEGLRTAWAPRLADPVRNEAATTIVDTFAGVAVNRGLLAALGIEGTADGPTCHIQAPLPQAIAAARRALEAWPEIVDAEAARQAPRIALRHPELVADTVLLTESRLYHVDQAGLHATLQLVAGAR